MVKQRALNFQKSDRYRQNPQMDSYRESINLTVPVSPSKREFLLKWLKWKWSSFYNEWLKGFWPLA